MKKTILTICFLFLGLISSTFAIYTYTISNTTYQRIVNLSNKVINIVESKYSYKKQEIFWSIIDTIDGYITLNKNKLTTQNKVKLLLFKTLILKHMGYKIEPFYELKIIN